MRIVDQPSHGEGFEQLEPRLELRALAMVLWHRRWIALTVFCIVAAAGSVVTLRAPRIYRAKVTVLIKDRAPKVLDQPREVYDLGAGSWRSDLGQYYQTQYALIRSAPVARRVVADLGLSAPTLTEALRAAGSESQEDKLAGDPLRGLPEGLRWKLELLGLAQGSSRAQILEWLDGFDSASWIQALIRVSPVHDTQLATILIDGTHPVAITAVANGVASAYIRLNLEEKVNVTGDAVTWLAEQRDGLQRKFEDAEQNLADFKRENNMVSVSMEDRRNMVAQTLSNLNHALAQTQVKRLQLESRRDRVERVHDHPGSLSNDRSLRSPLLENLESAHAGLAQQEAELIRRYTSEHPKLTAVRDRIRVIEGDFKEERDRIVDSVLQEYSEVVATETRLKNAIEETKAAAFEVNKRETVYNRLLRERDTSLDLYEMVLKRFKESSLSRMLAVNNVSMVEQARVPRVPIQPRVPLNLLLTLLLGLAASVGMPFLLEQLDNTVKSPKQVESGVGAAFLGLVPKIRTKATGSEEDIERARDLHVAQEPTAVASEACRSIRTNLLFASPDEPAKTILFTSCDLREGKSTVSTNMALVMAQSGLRTLLVDADMRKPRQHKTFKVMGVDGLSNLILGHVSIDNAVVATEFDKLDLLPCGPVPPNPAELLHAERFQVTLDELCKRYDRIIFDSPPIGAVTDGVVLASLVDGVVLVLRAGEVAVQVAAQARRQLEEVGGKVLGAVVNAVDLAKNHYYYRSYTQSYRYEDRGRGKRSKIHSG